MTSLSIKNVPDALVAGLRLQARRNHRSLQGELSAIVAAGLEPPVPDYSAILDEIRASGFSTEANSVRFIREDRGPIDLEKVAAARAKNPKAFEGIEVVLAGGGQD